MAYLTTEGTIGSTPLVRLQHIPGEGSARRGNVILGKLEGNSPADSVKDHPTLSMIKRAEVRGRIGPGGTLIEATPGNTGIALAVAAAVRDYRMVLIMPEDLSAEHRQSMVACGAEIIPTSVKGGIEYTYDLTDAMEKEGKGVTLGRLTDPDNPLAYHETTGPGLWRDTEGRIMHFVSAMGMTGAVTGVSRFLKEKNADIQIIDAQPGEGSRIPSAREQPEAYMPRIYDPKYIDRAESVNQSGAEHTARHMARKEGIFCGVSAAGALCVALHVTEEVEDATIMSMVCGQGDRYLSMGVFPARRHAASP